MKQSQKNCLQSPEMLLTSAMDGRAVNSTQVLRVDITMQRLSATMRREALFYLLLNISRCLQQAKHGKLGCMNGKYLKNKFL